jgi:tetratricopeptide (TPR) repeat protein
MRATLDWSYELLSEPERRLFRRLSAFAGGFTLEAAEAIATAVVVSGEPEEVPDLLGALGSLVEQSLVVVRPPEEGGEARYEMLEPVRQYALERLEQGGEAEAVRRRHAAFLLELAERAAPELRGPDELEWLELLEREYDNLRAAFSWALGPTGDARAAARLGWALEIFLWVRGYHREGRRWAEATLEQELPDALRARTLQFAATMAYIQGDYPAAGERWAETLRLSRRAGDPLLEAYAKVGEGVVEMARSEHEAAASSLEEAIALFERCEDSYMVSISRVWLGSVLLAVGEGERAQRCFEEALGWVRSARNPLLTLITFYNLAQSALAREDYAEASRLLEEAIGLSGQAGDKANLAHLLETLATVRALSERAENSAVLLGAAQGLLEEVGARVYNYYLPDRSLYEGTVAEVRSQLGDAAFEEAQRLGRKMTFEQAVQYALETEEPTSP